MLSKVKCPACGVKNPKERMTCVECGAALTLGRVKGQQVNEPSELTREETVARWQKRQEQDQPRSEEPGRDSQFMNFLRGIAFMAFVGMLFLAIVLENVILLEVLGFIALWAIGGALYWWRFTSVNGPWPMKEARDVSIWAWISTLPCRAFVWYGKGAFGKTSGSPGPGFLGGDGGDGGDGGNSGGGGGDGGGVDG